MLRLLPLVLFASGCATLGAQTLPEVQSSYNESLASTQDAQFLLNIVRLRYRDTPTFLEVASLTTQQTMSSGMGLGANVPLLPTLGVTPNANVSGSLSVTPTTTFSPLRGDDFVRRLITPVSLQTVAMLASSGWSMGRVMQLTVDRLNRISNAPTATGPTPELAPNTERFISLTRAMRALQLQQSLAMSMVRDDGSGDSGVLYLDPEAQSSEPFDTLHDLLELDPNATRVRLTEDPTRKDPYSVRMRMRSVLGALFYLSQSVEVPREHEQRGLVTITRDAAGNRFDWLTVFDGLFHVRSSSSEPRRAAVKVRHRDTWFFIPDDDLESKSTFMLLIQLFNMQAGRAAMNAAPVLTIPAGR